ncbi:hypothetical protein M011DRAFT_492812 [Sporormia fimetaria CBS 119925]|uniref:Guanine nucleotide exchange factor n=1 Tax=Sporormia fimetaria CBS 119925 TaxID=1340428 RepID=A0A6A6VKW8_9PLEO|nr:hypothetical protein M011DRAFT_492812 [Sporormia fimetaria CBS 119925]
MTSSSSAQGKVSQLLAQLDPDFEDARLSPTEQKDLLEEVKVLGRNPANAQPLFTKDGIHTLSRYAFERSGAVSQEALRCIANAMLLAPQTRQMLVNLGHAPKVAEKLKNDDIDDEFLAARILFLMTYDTKLDYRDLVTNHQLADSINAALQRHASRYTETTNEDKHTAPMDVMALSETAKLLFNITYFNQDLSVHFSSSIPHIFTLLKRRPLPTPPLQPPVNALVNALINLDLANEHSTQQPSTTPSPVFPPSDPSSNAEHLITILSRSITAYPEPELETAIAPVLTLIRRIYEIAPSNVQATMQSLLLPTTQDRNLPLGRTDTLPSRLLRLSTSALTPNLRTSIQAMLFELSDKDAGKFVQNVGYGYASGYLLSNNIPMPEGTLEGDAASDSQEGVPVNPITGQRLDREEPDRSVPMTREEREREAERLFVLFERLKATGVVDVENPVAEAYRTGRIEELGSDEEVD